MPFDESTPLTIEVTSADIANATTGKFTNSLATALRRYGDNLLLPGQEYDTVSQSCAFYADIQPRIMNGQVVSICEALVCTRVYACDVNTTLIILLESLGIPPTSPYTVTLVHG